MHVISSATLAIAALLLAATAAYPQHPVHKKSAEPAPCALLTPADLRTALDNSPVQSGKPGPNACTWQDAAGHDRVYLSIKPTGTDYRDFRNQMKASGHLSDLPGFAEDAFFVTSTGSDTAFYFVKRGQLVLLTVSGPNFSRAQNEGAEKILAQALMPKL